MRAHVLPAVRVLHVEFDAVGVLFSATVPALDPVPGPVLPVFLGPTTDALEEAALVNLR